MADACRAADEPVVDVDCYGAWTPLPLTVVHRTVMAARGQHLADLPGRLLDLAARHGRGDDMTVVALRVRRPLHPVDY